MHGLPQTLVTSTYIAEVDASKCNGCNLCVRACPVQAISLQSRAENGNSEKKRRKKLAKVDHSFCLGCGVCGLKCPSDAIKLFKRTQRVIHPETTFERVILQCLERGTLQNQLFDNPQSLSHRTMRTLLGGFLRLEPVKRALMSDVLRSRFLGTLATGVRFLGKGYIHEL